MVSSGVRQCPTGARGPLGSCESYGLDLVSVVCCQSLSHKGLRCFCGGGWGRGKKMKHWFIFLSGLFLCLRTILFIFLYKGICFELTISMNTIYRIGIFFKLEKYSLNGFARMHAYTHTHTLS